MADRNVFLGWLCDSPLELGDVRYNVFAIDRKLYGRTAAVGKFRSITN